LLWALLLILTLLLSLVLILCFGIVEIVAATGMCLAFWAMVYILSCPLCLCGITGACPFGPQYICGEVYAVYIRNTVEVFAVQKEEKSRRSVELKVRSSSRASRASTTSVESVGESVGENVLSPKVWSQCGHYAGSNASNLKKMSSICSIFNPVFLVLFITCSQAMVSVFIIYYVVDGEVFWVWRYFEPMALGLRDYALLFADVLTDPEALLEYLRYIFSLSISWSSLWDFSMSFDVFKFTILLLRTILYTMIGVVESLK